MSAPATTPGAVERPRDRRPWLRRAAAWLRENLFSSVWNGLLTVAVVALIALVVPPAFEWAVLDAQLAPADLMQCVRADGACWSMIQDKYRLILFGPYPPEEQWRAVLAIALFAAMIVYSCIPWAWAARRRALRLVAGWAAALAVVFWLLGGGLGLAPVRTGLWGGLPLTVILATAGVFFAFWMAIALALGRRSSLPAIRWICIAYIELMRGIPLISLLLVTSIMLPLALPEGMVIHPYLRAQLAFALFFAAYMAEAVRGGLQAIPEGQYAAAKALGLGYWQSMGWIILPQALRLIIPTMVNIFISAFKDTSLVVVVSMLDLLGAAKIATTDPKWWGLFIEPYVFVAAIYLVICATMSWYSRFLERRYGTAGAHD